MVRTLDFWRRSNQVGGFSPLRLTDEFPKRTKPVSDWVNHCEFKYICAIQVFEVIMFCCYISDAWKLCCLYVVLHLIIYFNDIDILAQRIFVINNSLFQSITGDIAPTLFFLKHTLEARSRCVVLPDILVGSRSHVDHCRQPISSNLLSGCIDAVAVNYGGFACPCAEVASSVVFCKLDWVICLWFSPIILIFTGDWFGLWISGEGRINLVDSVPFV